MLRAKLQRLHQRGRRDAPRDTEWASPVRTMGLALSTLILLLGLSASSLHADESFAEDLDLFELSFEDLMAVEVVTATMKGQSLRDAPASVAVASSALIKERGYRSIKDILVDTEGFNDLADVNEEVGTFRGTYATTTNKTLTLVDGHRMNEFELGRYNLDQFIGFDIIERVEIVRGPGSALYGTGALNGVINIITKKGKDVGGTLVKLRGGPGAVLASITYGNGFKKADVLVNFTFLQAKGTTVKQPASLDYTPPNAGDPPGQRSPQSVSPELRGLRQGDAGQLQLHLPSRSLRERDAPWCQRNTDPSGRGALHRGLH